MLGLAIYEAALTGIVLQIPSCRLITLRLLESTVLDSDVGIGHKIGLTTLHEEWRLFDRQALDQVGIMGQDAAAVADGKNTGDQFQLEFFRQPLDAFDMRK